jgi:hypothetical protein
VTELRTIVVAVGVFAAAPLTWWIAQALPDEGVDPSFADYFVRPNAVLVRLTVPIGVTALAAVFAAAVTVAKHRPGPIKLAATIAGAGAAAYAGFAYAVATAPVTGANIGAGLLVLLSPFWLAAMGLTPVIVLMVRRRKGCSS